MKRFLLHSFLFALLVFGLVVWIGMIEVSDDYIIHKTANTSYHKIAWNLNLINEHPEKIKGCSVFFGSSLMQGDVSDSLLSARGLPTLNFALNGTGHEVVLYFLKRIIPHKPGKIYLHFYKTDKSALHGMTPLLYTPKALLQEEQSFSMDFIKFLFKRIYFVADYLFWKASSSSEKDPFFSKYGTVYREDVFAKEKYAEIKKETTDDYFYSFILQRKKFVKETEKNLNSFYYKLVPIVRRIRYSFMECDFIFNTKSQSIFALKCLEVCRENNIDTKRLYLPMVTDAKINKDFDGTFYVPRGYFEVVSLNSFSFLDSSQYWADMVHMSREGSIVFTQKLLEEKIIQP